MNPRATAKEFLALFRSPTKPAYFLSSGLLLLSFALPASRTHGQELEKIPDNLTLADLDRHMLEWRKAAEEKMKHDRILKTVVAKYSPVVLHSRRYSDAVFGGAYLRSAYSFVYETSDKEVHGNDVQIVFDHSRAANGFSTNMVSNQQNLIADLGEADFTKDPDPKKIDLDGEGLNSWDPKSSKAVEGHVYLERVRDERGNNFYVLFQIVLADKENRYIAFVWRPLPGGKVVKNK